MTQPLQDVRSPHPNVFPLALQMNQVVPMQDLAEVFTWFRTMRETQPVYHDKLSGLWHIFRHADVQQVLGDHAHFSSQALGETAGAGDFLSGTLVAIDPPDHRQMRSLVNLAFTPQAVERLTERITQISQDTLDAV